jgi:radical SAM superfamily enzyme YgiQ (UPF0313 family)
MTPGYKRILLVNPGRESLLGTHEPLNLALLAAFVRAKGFAVKIADEFAGEDVIRAGQSFQPDIVGITATSALLKRACAISAFFREKKIPTVLGGAHAAIRSQEALRFFDMVVPGEGEFPLLRILSDGHREGIFSSDQPVDLNQMPFPARDLLCTQYYSSVRGRFPQFGWFIHFPWDARVMSILISRGCSGTCAFCRNPYQGMPFRMYSPDRVMTELEFLQKTYGIKDVVFVDDNIFSDRLKIREILTAMAESPLRMNWAANARVDSIDEDILRLAKKAGCLKLNFGFESGSPKMLMLLNKQTRIETAERAVDLCRKHEIKVSGFFIVGHPEEEPVDVHLTRKMIRKLHLDSISAAIATPFPGTRWWEIAEDRMLVPDHLNWDAFDFEHLPIKLNQRFSADQLRRIRFRYYFSALLVRPGYLWRMIKATVMSFSAFRQKLRNIVRLPGSLAGNEADS